MIYPFIDDLVYVLLNAWYTAFFFCDINVQFSFSTGLIS